MKNVRIGVKKEPMSKWKRRLLALLTAAALLLSLGAGSALAVIRDYPSLRVYVDGLLTARAYTKDGEVYLSPADICACLGLETEESYEPRSQRTAIRGQDLVFDAENGYPYLSVNGRYLYNESGFLYTDGRSFFPLPVIEKMFNARGTLSVDGDRLDLELREAELLQGWDHYYRDTYGADNVLWLCRIISAESRDQPFAGMIGVGNVVLNRVESDMFPDTIFDVVFDTHNGVQFSPVIDGTIYKPASDRAVIAACLCLEGYSTVGESLFFASPSLSDITWLQENYTYVTTIGGHVFYK